MYQPTGETLLSTGLADQVWHKQRRKDGNEDDYGRDADHQQGFGLEVLHDWNARCLVTPNVRANRPAEADAGWPRKDDFYHGLERPDGGCRSGSGVERGVRRH